MSREIVIGELVIGHFPVLEEDGYTKHSGLTGTDFVVTVYLDSLPIVTAVTITEIGISGEYQYTFTPVVEGVYDVTILSLYSHDLLGESFESVDSTTQQQLIEIKTQADKIDLVPTLGPAAVTSGSLMDRVMNKDINKTFNQAHDSLEAIGDRIG